MNQRADLPLEIRTGAANELQIDYQQRQLLAEFGSDAVKNKGLGLISMSERLDAIGGSLKIWTRPDEGTRLEIAVPHERLLTTSA
jgi:signal transduction histidine kinase